MAGHPAGDFDVTALAVTPNIVRKGQAIPELFDVSATFDGTSIGWDTVEWVSDPAGGNIPQLAQVRWFLESIGPGPEMVIAETAVPLTIGGGPYTATVTGIDPDDTFLQDDASTPTVAPGVYRLQCRVDVVMGPSFFTGYFDTDVLFRAAAA